MALGWLNSVNPELITILFFRILLAFTLTCYSFTCFAQQNWHAGDLIFRTGTETVSDLVMLSDDSGYSHVGMLVGEPHAWQVIHATPEEVSGQGNKVVLDDLEFFTSSERSLRHTVYHVEASNDERELAMQWAYQQIGQPFTLLDPEGVYCTTLIWKAWLYANVDLQVSFTKTSIPLIDQQQFLLPSALIKSPRVTHIEE